MENNNENQIPQQEEKSYAPRPKWQVNMARIGLVIFILFVLWQVFQIAGGGL